MVIKRVGALLLLMLLLCSSVLAADTNIVVSFYPVHIFTMNLIKGIEGVSLKSLAAPTTGCLHDYQLLSSDMQKLSRADVFIINGAGMETYMDVVKSQMPNVRVIDSSLGIELLPAASTTVLSKNKDKHGSRGFKRGISQFNSHIWLAPENAIKMVENIALSLKEILPDKAEKLNENLLAYKERLLRLDEKMHEGLKPFAGRKIVTFHEAFPYFTREFKLESLAVLALEPDAPISSGLLAEMSQIIKGNGLPPLFTENQYQSKAVKIISEETGAKSYELDPVVMGDYFENAYEQAQMKNLEVLQKAFSEGK